MSAFRAGRVAVAATSLAAALACLLHATALATSAEVDVVACPGPLTWTFSSPLTPAFTPQGAATLTQTAGAGTVCAGAGAYATGSVQFPLPDWEATELQAAPYSNSTYYFGSCTVATVGITAFGATGETGLLIGGSVVVSPPFSDSPGDQLSEVDLLVPDNPCSERVGTGEGNDVGWYTAQQ